MTPVRFVSMVVALLAGTTGADAVAGVYRCTDPGGKTIYSNAPCEDQGAKTAKSFKKDELRPNTVKMPKAPPPEVEKAEGGGPGGLIGALRGKPLPKRELFLEGDPDANPKGGVKHPVLDKMMGKK
ncbi:MAG: DUF4124 domain-containing protein [Burkholderiales bacterium]